MLISTKDNQASAFDSFEGWQKIFLFRQPTTSLYVFGLLIEPSIANRVSELIDLFVR